MVGTDKIQSVLKSLDQLQPLPGSVARVLKATDEQLTTGTMLAEIIGLDQALAANVIRLANAASLGYGSDCSTLSDAVMRLGFKKIRTIVLGVGASGPLMSRLNGYRMADGQLWNHSVATATAAQWLSRYFAYPNFEEAYVAGLLHDIGKLLLDRFVMVDRQRIMNAVKLQKKMLCEAEEEQIGLNHARAGSLMAEKWTFPEVLSEAILCHHQPLLATKQPKLAAIINLANALSSKAGSDDQDPFGRVAHPDSFIILSITDKVFEKVGEEMDHYLKIKTG